MNLKEKILDRSSPVTLFEVLPPERDSPTALAESLRKISELSQRGGIDAINIPEIRDESGKAPRRAKFVERVEPRMLARTIQQECQVETIVNRCTVYDAAQEAWLRETYDQFGVRHLVLVGGESSKIAYPGPSVHETAQLAHAPELDYFLGGITIPSRAHEPQRIRAKHERGLRFFTSQVLFDSNDIVWLVKSLSGLDVRLFLSFAPISHPRDVAFLRWLGADLPADVVHYVLQNEETSTTARKDSVERSIDLATRILTDVFENLPAFPPAIGLNIEHITRRNYEPAIRLLQALDPLYRDLVLAASRVR